MRKNKKKNIVYIMVMLFFVITIFLYGPIEIVSNNANNFEFGVQDFWIAQALLALVITFIGFLILYILPEKICDFLSKLIFSFALCCYIQVMFLNGKMESLLGQEIVFPVSIVVVNILIWILLFVLVIVGSHLLKEGSNKIIAALSGLLFGMQFVALMAAVIGTLTMNSKDISGNRDGFLSTKGLLELSSKNNVIVFILDYFDGNTMQAILEEKPDMLDGLDGFTYYPNCTSEYSRTYPSIDYLLTGEPCYFDLPVEEYIDGAFEHGSFIPQMDSAGTDIGIYTTASYIGDAGKSIIDNFSYGDISLSYYSLFKYNLKMVLFRDLPYVLKPRFKYDSTQINYSVVKHAGASEPFPHSDDEWFDRQIFDTGLSANYDTPVFRFYHLGGVHLNLSDQVGAGIRALEITFDYLDKMRELGIYDDSTIIITTDHGSSGGFGGTLDLPQKTAVPLMIVKKSGDHDTPLAVSNAPVSQREFQPTVLSALGIPYEGMTFSEVPEDEPRTRVYHYTGLYSDEEGEVELREYEVTGDARLPENYSFTGKTWDILYSENKVAGK